MKRVLALVLLARVADADPYVLRADALATTASPAGLVTLTADGSAGPNLSAEAVVWTGATGSTAADHADGDVLVIALHARTADGRVRATLGRFVATLGALRPVHVDGARVAVRLPYRIDVDAYAGVPVQPDLTASRAWNWVVGGRVSRRLGDWGSVGVAYLQQRNDGRLAAEEVGVDAGASIGKHADLAGKLAYDLVNPGLAEAKLTASERLRAVRAEVYASYVAPSHILPATSLFTVLGDVPAVRVGTTRTWKAAPRLDLAGDLAVMQSDGDPIDGPVVAQRPTSTLPSAPDVGEVVAPAATLRATLRLDDRGTSALGAELRRDGAGDAGWTGARATARFGLADGLTASTELELVIPDRDTGLGRAWPWGSPRCRGGGARGTPRSPSRRRRRRRIATGSMRSRSSAGRGACHDGQARRTRVRLGRGMRRHTRPARQRPDAVSAPRPRTRRRRVHDLPHRHRQRRRPAPAHPPRHHVYGLPREAARLPPVPDLPRRARGTRRAGRRARSPGVRPQPSRRAGEERLHALPRRRRRGR